MSALSKIQSVAEGFASNHKIASQVDLKIPSNTNSAPVTVDSTKLHSNNKLPKEEGLKKTSNTQFIFFLFKQIPKDLLTLAFNLYKKLTGYYKKFINIKQASAPQDLIDKIKESNQQKTKPIILWGERHNNDDQLREIDKFLLKFLKEMKKEGYQTVSLELMPEVANFIEKETSFEELKEKYDTARTLFDPHFLIRNIPFSISEKVKNEIENFINNYSISDISLNDLEHKVQLAQEIKKLGFNVIYSDQKLTLNHLNSIEFMESLKNHLLKFTGNKEITQLHKYFDQKFIDEAFLDRDRQTADDISAIADEGLIHIGGKDHMNINPLKYQTGNVKKPYLNDFLKQRGKTTFTINASLSGDENNGHSLKPAYNATLINSSS